MTAQIRKSSPTILIADSEHESASELRDLLESWKYPVEIVSDGLSALHRLCEDTPPAVAILDYDLPALTGLEVVSELRLRSRKDPVWTMLLCSAPDTERVLMANDAGVDDFLAKPVDPLELRIRLHAAERVQSLYYDLHESSEAIRYLASHDHLTGLWSREALLGLLFQETDRVQRMRTLLSFILLDIDGFSQVNLELGYEAGDTVLQQLAARFRRYLRSYDLIGRCGEDEFLIALPGCNSADALVMASRLRQCVIQPAFDLNSGSISITASFGISQSRGRSPLVVLREAERALADAKTNGRDCVREFSVLPQSAATQNPAPGDLLSIDARRKTLNSGA
jgi:two-component system cell cycle response regulator